MQTLAPIMGLIGGLMGVTLGWSLNLGTDAWRKGSRKRKIRESLHSELNILQGMIPQKQDIVRKCINSLDHGQVLPGRSCHVLTIAYDAYAAELCECVDDKERCCLHFIYETLKIGDLFLDMFFDEYRELGKCEETRGGRDAYFRGALSDMNENYARVMQWIRDYLEGMPPNCLWD